MSSKRATYETLLALPEDVRAEVLAGEVVVSPSPLPEHGRIHRSLGSAVGKPFDDDDGRGGPGGWWILLEVDVRFGEHDIVRPDLVGWRRARLPKPWGVRPIEVVPDWICEIQSPSNAAVDRVQKAALYAEHGVPHYWLVDPAERTLEALALRDGAWIRAAYGDDAKARIAPFEAIELDLSRVFPPR